MSDIEIDDEHAAMSQATFDDLPEYEVNQERVAGKCWRTFFKNKWWLMWYTPELKSDFREILITEAV